jgi:hypothetical protein
MRHRHLRWLAILILTLSACGGLGGASPTADPMAMTVTLNAPPDGAVIYASALYVAGTLADAPDSGSVPLLIRLRKPDGSVIAQARVETTPGDWSAEMIHDYSGDPTRAVVEVLPAVSGTGEAGVFASSEIVLGKLSERPEGAFITLIAPEDGREIGGDEVQVMGTVSGVSAEALDVTLVDSNAQVLDTQTAVIAGRYPIDEIPWTVSLTPGEYRGNAIITVSGGSLSEQITVIVTDSAG